MDLDDQLEMLFKQYQQLNQAINHVVLLTDDLIDDYKERYKSIYKGVEVNAKGLDLLHENLATQIRVARRFLQRCEGLLDDFDLIGLSDHNEEDYEPPDDVDDEIPF